jgi:probable rRNA maturation factor
MHATEKTALDAGADEGESACPADPDAAQPPEPSPSSHTAIDLLDTDNCLDAEAACWLRDAGVKALAAMRPAEVGGEVRVRIVNDAEMCHLHEAHLGDPSTTDVLTFDCANDPQAPLDVDIVVCFDEAHRQADRRRGKVERELLLYIVHGALHCSGYDDHDDDSFRRMHRREDEILRAIGVGDVYACEEDSAEGQS